MTRLKLKNIFGKGLFFISVLLIISFLSFHPVQAVQEGTPDKEQNTATIESKEGTEKDKQQDQGYLYDPAGRTDPFKSFIVVREEQLEKEQKKPRTYLETLELSQLSLSVIAISPKERWAMVRDSKGDGHVIKEGTPIGKNGGVVYKITEGEVIIREEYVDFRGRKQFRDISKTTPVVR